MSETDLRREVKRLQQNNKEIKLRVFRTIHEINDILNMVPVTLLRVNQKLDELSEWLKKPESDR